VIAVTEYADKCLLAEYNNLSHADMLQAKRDLKTMKKARAVIHDLARKHNAQILAQVENRRIKMEGV